MYAKKFEDIEFESQEGGEYKRLVPSEMTEHLSVSLVKVPKGSATPKHVHEDNEQIYIILKGSGVMQINDQEEKVSGGMVTYTPKRSTQGIKNTEEDDLIYIAVS